MKITTVVGARPNFMKAAALFAELRLYAGVRARLVHTGQHYDAQMSEAFFRDLELPVADVNLGVRAESAIAQTAEMMQRLEAVLIADRPDVVLVVGDVNSTLAGALVAVKMGIPLAHVEAGLRSFDRSMPEEVNRVLIDAVSDWCFTTEPAANENLAREGVPGDRIHFVGNVMIDTLFRFRERAAASSVLERLGLHRRGYAVLTLHRPANVDDAGVLARTLRALRTVTDEVQVVFPVHPRTRSRLADGGDVADLAKQLSLTEPLPYLDFVQLMANAVAILTDSGGIQEEALALGVPCLTLRTTTERPVTVTHGGNRIVGVDPEKIATAWKEIQDGAWPAPRLPDLWDGKAAERIVKILRA